MKTFYNCKLLQKMYTPLTSEEGLNYIGKWFEGNNTAFNKTIIVVKSVNNDGTISYVEKALKTINIIPSEINKEGVTSLPLKQIMVDEQGIDSKLKKGMLVYSNLNIIMNISNDTPVQIWVSKKRIPFNLTTKHKIYTVIMDGFTPGEFTNLGKYGTWDLEIIRDIKKNKNS